MLNDIFPKSCRLWDNVEKLGRSRQATDDNMAHAHCMLYTYGYKYILRIYNTYCLLNAWIVMWTRLSITLAVWTFCVLFFFFYQISVRTVCDMWRLSTRCATFVVCFISLKTSCEFCKTNSSTEEKKFYRNKSCRTRNIKLYISNVIKMASDWIMGLNNNYISVLDSPKISFVNT